MEQLIIPTSPIDVSHVGSGWMPETELHQRGGKYFQEPSNRSQIVFGLMFPLAFAIWMVSWNSPYLIFPNASLRPIFAVCALLIGVCGFAFQNRSDQRIIIDHEARTVTLFRSQSEAVLHWLVKRIAQIRMTGKRIDPNERIPKPPTKTVLNWSEILGVQVCGGPVAYQTNLVFHNEAGELDRFCLASHTVESFCQSLARQYSDAFGFELFNQTTPRTNPISEFFADM